MGFRPMRQTAIINADIAVVTNSSCLAATLARLLSSRPRYWDATIAPPVARAEKMLMSRMLIASTRDTLDMAASPVLATMMVSAMPMVTARNCSTIRGKINLRRSFAVNMPPPSFSNLNDRGRPPRMQALKR